jgi:hypothetical protein
MILTTLFVEVVQRTPFGHSAAAALWNTSIDLGGLVGTTVLSACAARRWARIRHCG